MLASRLAYLAAIGFLWLVLGVAQAQQATLSHVKILPSQTATRIVLGYTTGVKPQVFTLANPLRVVVDFPGTKIAWDYKKEKFPQGVIESFRIGWPTPKTMRLVLTLRASATLRHSALPRANGRSQLLIVLSHAPLLEPAFQSTAVSRAPKSHSRKLPITAKKLPTALKPRTAILKPLPAETKHREILIAIDAGHGGADTGAIGRRGTREKVVVLAVAKILKRLVDEDKDMRAMLTRSADYFVPLRQRMRIARKQRAELFISIHADSFQETHARGASVYVLSPRGASSEAARWLAERENRADLVLGLANVNLDDKDDVVASVLLDLSQTATNTASQALARRILSSLKQTGSVHKSYVERAGFMVLKAPDMPSVLVETAFISNPEEELRLRDPKHQRRLAEAIYRGIRNYLNEYPGHRT